MGLVRETRTREGREDLSREVYRITGNNHSPWFVSHEPLCFEIDEFLKIYLNIFDQLWDWFVRHEPGKAGKT